MEKRERQFIPGLSILLLSAVLLGLVGALLRDFRGVSYGVIGALIWAGALFVTFLLGTIYISRRLLPLPDNPGWAEAFNLLWRNYLLGMTDVVARRKREPTTASTRKKKDKGATIELAPSFNLIGAGFLYSHEAAAIMRGNGYSRADGPGLVFLEPSETVARVFDLRPQSRRQAVSATTRDGIPVETSVSVTFQVRRPSPNERRPRSANADPLPYPYEPQAIFDLSYSSAVAGNQEKRDWAEQVAPQAAALLVSELGKYTLDELLLGGGGRAISAIKQGVKRGLELQQQPGQLQTLSRGIELLGVGVGAIELPEDVSAKRITTWQVGWQNRVSQQLVRADIDAQRLYGQARAQAQIENIENLLQSIEAMRRQNETELHEVIMKRLLQVLQAMSSEKLADRMTTPPPSLTNLVTDASTTILKVVQNSET